jgi:hypothetical protein
MPSLKDLFRTQPLPTQNNKVGAEVYAIRNSKDIPISTSNGILNATIFPLVQKTLRSSGLLTNRKRETLIEQELTGLRAIRGLASPIIYGTDIIRLKRRTTNVLDVMKNASAGSDGGADRGIVGNFINRAKDKALEFASQLGIEFPENLIPTRIALNRFFIRSREPDTMRTLAEIRNDGAGNLIGQFLAKNAKGTPNQIGNQVIGAGIDVLKNKVRKKLFGSPLQAAENLANKSPNQVQYDSVDRYSKTIIPQTPEVAVRNDLSSIVAEKEVLIKDIEIFGAGADKIFAEVSPLEPSGAPVSTPSSTDFLPHANSQQELDALLDAKYGKDRKNKLAPVKSKIAESPGIGNAPEPVMKEIQSNLAEGRKEGQREVAKSQYFNNPKFLYFDKIKYSSTVDARNPEIFSRNDASTRLSIINGFVSSFRIPATEPTMNARIAQALGPTDKTTEEPELPPTGDIPSLDKFPPSKFSQIVNKTQSELGGSRFNEQAELAAFRSGNNTNFQYNSTIPYGKTVDPSFDDISLRNDMSTKLDAIDREINNLPNKLPILYKIGRIKSIDYSKRNNRIRQNSLESKLGITNGSDILNKTSTWYSATGEPPEGIGTKQTDDYDLIPFRFWSISKKTGVTFRATITGLTETISPSWNASKFIGNPYSFYTYDGVERSVSFNFKMYALNGNELKVMWQKLSFLNTFAYPQKYAFPYVTPPFMKFTLGNMYNNKEGFIENLSFTIEDNTPWEIGTNGNTFGHISSYGLTGGRREDVLDKEDISPIDLTEYKLPTIIDVQMTIKFIESQSTFWSAPGSPKRVYYYGGDRSTETENERSQNLAADGSVRNPDGMDANSFSTSNINRDVLTEQQRASFNGTISTLNSGVSTTLATNASTNLNTTTPLGGAIGSGNLFSDFQAGSAQRRSAVFGNTNIFNR